MRRSRLATLLAGTLLAAFLLPSVALAGAQATPRRRRDPTIKLGCALRASRPRHPDRERIVCRWSALEGVDVRAYRLWRIVDARARPAAPAGRPRQPGRAAARTPTATSGAATRTRYRVVAIGTDGSRVGVSNARRRLRVGRPAERLGLSCAVRDRRRPPGRRVPLGEGRRARRPSLRARPLGRRRARESGSTARAIDGRRSFLDTDVKAGQTIRYEVVALAARRPDRGRRRPRRRRGPDHRHAGARGSQHRRGRHRHTCPGGRPCGGRRRRASAG